MWVSLAPSMAPSAMPIQSRCSGSQNSEAPQRLQKPRRTFSEEWYQVTWSPPCTVTAAFGTSLETK